MLQWRCFRRGGEYRSKCGRFSILRKNSNIPGLFGHLFHAKEGDRLLKIVAFATEAKLVCQAVADGSESATTAGALAITPLLDTEHLADGDSSYGA
jgi:hypothetical protein